MTHTDAGQAFRAARDVLLAHRRDAATACREFRWPEAAPFNWALDHFDHLAHGNEATALWIVEADGRESRRSFAALSAASDAIANGLRAQGLRRGDRVLVMLPNTVELWETMLALMKLGAVLSPATMLLSSDELADRVERGEMRAVIADSSVTALFAAIPGAPLRIAVGAAQPGWIGFESLRVDNSRFVPDGPTAADDPCVIYFTSGTTAKPKMVLHTQRSYPVGHLSTLYWLGLRAGDIHLNISSPGWAKHAWSCFFAPWTVGATVFIVNQPRFDAGRTLATLARCGVTSLCAPPTAWRAIVLENLAIPGLALRELTSAGEPLNPDVYERILAAWGLPIREGYGQTESTAMLGNPPGQPLRPGSLGRPLPGYRIALLDPDGRPAREGEISVLLGDDRPAGLMAGYVGDADKTMRALGGAAYGSSDIASIEDDGTLWYVGRNDDVFKSSDYRISPFELESVLVEHPAVAEAAVVESPDARRLFVPKACVMLRPGVAASRDTAEAILRHARERLAPFKRIRILEFCELPKTVSGKIRRNELRRIEAERRAGGGRGADEYFEAELQR
ncbi:AMP-binding protein [Nevskia sp.]|uniref:AMP-binding protein n=1 Tax=Nevskia sp. TaxID=1929292 RepID=UPI003F712DBA